MVADVDTDELGPAQAAQADSELQAGAAATTSSRPGPPDGFSYHLSLPDARGAGAGSDIVVDESAVPDGLRPLLDLAAGRAHPAG